MKPRRYQWVLIFCMLFLFCASATAQPCVTAPSGLIGWWPAEGNANDSIGGNNGTLVNSVSFTNGMVGQAFSFDGVSSYVSIPDSPSLDTFVSSITIETWIKVNQLTANSNWKGIVTKGNSSWRLQGTAGASTVAFSVTGVSPNGDLSGSRNVNDGQWHHVAGVYDGTNMFLYVDGTLDVSQPATGTISQNNLPLCIGANGNGYFFNGLVDEESIYNRALTAAEVQSIYNAGSSGKCPVPPTIIVSLTNETVVVGDTASFSVMASGTWPLNYQWSFNGANIEGATNSILTLTNVQPADAGSYSVTVTNLLGSITSSNALLTVNLPPPCAPAPSGLVGWWPAEGNANDVAGTNNGALVNNVSFAAGEVGQAFSFNGVSSYVSIPDSPSLDTFVSSITIETWIKVNQLTANSNWKGIVTKGNSSWRLQGTAGASTVAFSATGVSPNGDLTGSRNVNDGQWHHVAGVYDGTNMFLYVDGTLDVSQPATGSISQNNLPLCIGANGNGYFFNGLVDEESIYNRALTASEIQTIYAAGSGGKCKSPTPAGIVTQPTNQTAVMGATVGFSVVVTGSSPLRFQWIFNGTNITGATNITLTLTNVQLAQAGTYAILVTNLYGAVLSSNADLTVLAFPPAIVSQPTNQTVMMGGTASFSVTASGTPPLNYQWAFNGTDIMGATNTTLMLTNVQMSQAGSYAVLVTNVAGSVLSSNAVLTVNPPPPCTPAPSGLVDWWPGEGNANDIVGSNNGTLVNDVSFAPGEVGQAFSFDGVSSYVSIPDSPSLDTFVSSITIEAWIKFNQLTADYNWEGIITKGNSSWRLQATAGANTVTFSASGVSPQGDLYGSRNVRDGQWHHVAGVYNGTNMLLYVDGTLDVSQPATGTIAQNNLPLCIGANGNGYFFNGLIDEVSIYNRALTAAEIQSIYSARSSGKCQVPPTIILAPTNQTVTVGGTATFSVAASGTLPLSYQWYFYGTPLSDGGRIVGSTTSTLLISNVQTNDSGLYQVVVTNNYGTITSAVARLVVKVQITSQPSSQAVLLGSNITFTVAATGTLPLWYQWYFNGTPLLDDGSLSGSTTPTLGISNVKASNAGAYTVVVTNLFGVAISVTASLTVQSNATASVRYVDLNNTNPLSPYLDWNTAATNIQDAIDAAVDGDTILVTNGLYQTGGRVVYGILTNRLAITKAVTVQSVNGPTVAIIQGNPSIGTNAVRCIYLTNNAVLVGFTLTNGATIDSSALDSAHDCFGGGAWCESTNSVLTNCVLILNSAQSNGGGANSGTLNNCILSGNSAQNGGGTYSSTLNNCTLTNNAARSGGGASSSGLNNCILVNNNGDYNGGGASYSVLNNCVLTGNFSDNEGGGTYSCTLNNCTLTANTASESGAGAFGGALNNCILYYNNGANYSGASLNYCCTTPYPDGFCTGNITLEPQLTDGTHIGATSPCRGAGSAAYTSGLDIDGEVWLNPPSIGCDEYYATGITGSITVAIQADNTSAEAGFTVVNFTGRIVGYASLITWNFGDGTIVSNQLYIVAHRWMAMGDYPVVFTAYNDSNPGGVSTSVTIHVFTQPIHYVALNSTNPTTPYSSWATAATNIQDAVDASIDGDLILVTNGVYQTGGQVVYGSLTNRLAVTKSALVQSVNGPVFTVIQGYQAPGTTNDDSAVRCVYLTNNAALVGFTLTNGATRASGDSTTEECGGGVFGESASSTVSSCVIAGNSAYNSGGGAMQVTLNNCMLAGNSSVDGGGVANSTLSNCALTGNSAGQCGGGAIGSTLYNCTVIGNSANYGGGVGQSTFLYNCIVFYNFAPNNPNYVMFYGLGIVPNAPLQSEFDPAWSILYNCCTTPLPVYLGGGNITSDPLLVNPSGGDFHLQSNSPCINTGNNAYVSTVTDLDGNLRIVSGTVDIGAYEFQETVQFIASIQANETNVDVGYALTFAGSFLGGNPDTFIWNFGDGTSISNQISVSHSWATVGDYLVTLTAFNSSNPAGTNAKVTVHVMPKSVHYVSLASTNPITPYLSWNTAATNIQDAIDAANSHDSILATNGVYQTGSRVDENGVTNRIIVTKPLILQSVNGPTSTLIDGGGTVRCVYLTNFAGLTGFTLTNGTAYGRGGGVCGVGGGWTVWSTVVVSNCLITGNSAYDSGGGTAQATLNNCILSGNSAPNDGGGAYESFLNNCVVTANLASYGGGVSYCTLNNCTLTGNLAEDQGGGVAFSSALFNCIVYYNTNYSGDGRFINYDPSVSLSYCCTTPDPGSPAGTVSNITSAPLFVNPAGGNFRLQTNSPCIDAGNNIYVSGTTDLDGRSRIVNGTVDMGAYEFQGAGMGEFIAWLQQYGLPTDGSVDYADLDGNGMNVYQDWIADLNPTNALSVLKMASATQTNNPAGLVVTWQSVDTRSYYLQRSTNLVASSAFSSIQSNIVGQAGSTSYTDTTATNSCPYFYRVGVQ